MARRIRGRVEVGLRDRYVNEAELRAHALVPGAVAERREGRPEGAVARRAGERRLTGLGAVIDALVDVAEQGRGGRLEAGARVRRRLGIAGAAREGGGLVGAAA